MSRKTAKLRRPYPSVSNVEAILGIRGFLKSSGYDESTCSRVLGISDVATLWFELPRLASQSRNLQSPLEMLVTLFMLNIPVRADEAARFLPREVEDALVETTLVSRSEGYLSPLVSIFPCDGLYIATDLTEDRAAVDQVFWLSRETYWLARAIARFSGNGRTALDVGFGSGVHALLLSRNGFDVCAVDVNPRTIYFAKFNRLLNNVPGVTWRIGDLYDNVGSEGFDLLVSHPPFSPDDESEPGRNYWSGGLRGDSIVKEIVIGLPRFLMLDGIAVICTLLTYQPGETLEGKLQDWMQFDRRLFDVEWEREEFDYGGMLKHRRDVDGVRRYSHWLSLGIERSERAIVFFRRKPVCGAGRTMEDAAR